jgi:repressor LexA
MPTFDDMRTHMEVKSKSGIFNLLCYMEWKGYIKRHPAHARAIQIIKEYENE